MEEFEKGGAGSSPYGIRVGHYRLLTQGAPGLLFLLLVLQLSFVPINLDFLDQDITWAELLLVGVPLLLLALPSGFLLSGVSFFLLGAVIFPMRNQLRFFSPAVRLLILTVGEPKFQPDNPREWTQYINDVGFIIRRQVFRGPREDAPDKVLAVAIFARSLALLLIIYGSVRLLGVLELSSGEAESLEIILILLAVGLLLFFAAFFELYREFTIAIAADQFAAYHAGDSKEVEAIGTAKEMHSEYSSPHAIEP